MGYKFVLNETSYHGYGALDGIKEVVNDKGFKKIAIFVDSFLKENNIAKKVTDEIDGLDVEYTFYTDIKPNPTIKNVLGGLKVLKDFEADAVIAIGGGSVIDCSKAAAIINTNPEFKDVKSLEGLAETKNPATPIIAIPTTAGTAAEVTINYVITDEELERKMVCVDPHDIPIVAIVAPEMMESMPASLTAATGMDALTHAIEGYTTRDAWEMTDMFHIEAIRLIGKHLRGAVENTPEGREGMALAQYIAGMGFSNVGLGIDHSMAHTLSAHYDTPHGVACAMFLPIVMEFNRDYTGERYKDIAIALGVEGVDKMTQEEYRDAAIKAVEKLSADVGIPKTNERIKEEDLDQLATDALNDACYPGNPREATKEQVIEMFRKLMA